VSNVSDAPAGGLAIVFKNRAVIEICDGLRPQLTV